MVRYILLLLVVMVAAFDALAAASLVLAPGEALTAAHAEILLRPALPPAEPGTRIEIRFQAPPLPLANPATVPTHLWLEDLKFDPVSGRVEAHVRARLESGESSRLQFLGELRRLIPVPVPRMPIPQGTILDPAMFEMVWLPQARLHGDTVREMEALVGLEARRRLAAGRPVVRAEVVEARLVRRGERVTAVYSVPGLEVTGLLIALDDGTVGAMVRLMNPDSRRSLKGIVIGPRRVRVFGSQP